MGTTYFHLGMSLCTEWCDLRGLMDLPNGWWWSMMNHDETHLQTMIQRAIDFENSNQVQKFTTFHRLFADCSPAPSLSSLAPLSSLERVSCLWWPSKAKMLILWTKLWCEMTKDDKRINNWKDSSHKVHYSLGDFIIVVWNFGIWV